MESRSTQHHHLYKLWSTGFPTDTYQVSFQGIQPSGSEDRRKKEVFTIYGIGIFVLVSEFYANFIHHKVVLISASKIYFGVTVCLTIKRHISVYSYSMLEPAWKGNQSNKQIIPYLFSYKAEVFLSKTCPSLERLLRRIKILGTLMEEQSHWPTIIFI